MLELSNIHSYYGTSHILQGVSFKVAQGKCVGLLGRNGAGKTTTIHTISGLQPFRQGSIRFKDNKLKKLSTHQISRLGIGLVPQGRRIFPSLTVKENLLMAARAKTEKSKEVEKAKEWNLKEIYDLFPILEERENSMGTQLSGGQQQMLAIGRALMTNPSLLLLDEPSEGLAPLIIEKVGDIIKKLKTMGLSILLVEQNLSLAFETMDVILIMNRGEIVWEGSSDELKMNEKIQSKYLGVE